MSRPWLPVVLLLVGSVAAVGRAQKPADPASKENIAAALKLTLAAAAEYDIRVGDDTKPLELKREPVLQWSNPARGEVHGNVFVWARAGRPLVVGSLFKWFSPETHMSHEFQSLAEGPLAATFHETPVWKAADPGVKFGPVPDAPAPAATDAQRLVQMKQLAKDFSGSRYTRQGVVTDLRLLPQPVYRYAVPKQGVHSGGLFAFVEGTDPDIFLLIEARGKDAAGASWQYAAARMVSTAGVRLTHRDREVWSDRVLTWNESFTTHKLPYTTYRFNEVPDFLRDALPKPRP